MTSPFYSPGDTCVLRGIVDRRVWLAQSVIVVHDTPAGTALLLRVGAACAFPAGYWRWKLERDTSQGDRWQEAQNPPFTLRRFGWLRNRVLMFLEPDKYYSTWLFWDGETVRFRNYYINFQLPFRRSKSGFDTLDLALDILIEPYGSWQWKDEEDYREGIRSGGIRPEWMQGVEDSLPEVFALIHARRPPLDGSWLDWRPDPAWRPPTLPPGWDQYDEE